MNCELCNSDKLLHVYTPKDTKRNLKVYVCQICGLTQSHPRYDKWGTGGLRLSSGADWGNVRYGKQFRTKPVLDILGKFIEWKNVRTLLDVGSSRGDFIKAILGINDGINIWAVEPDGNIINTDVYKRSNVVFTHDRIENLDTLPIGFYDLIVSLHTLEHLRHPKPILERLWRATKREGHFFVEVPNLDFICQTDVVEEFFIDKHLCHFDSYTLTMMLGKAGFSQLGISTDRENIGVMCKKGLTLIPSPMMSDLATRNSLMIQDYAIRLETNINKLGNAVIAINNMMKSKKVVIWGAGRIFNALVKRGLDTQKLTGIVDKFLPIETVGIMSVLKPEQLESVKPNIIIIASRTYQNQIRQEIAELGLNCEVLGWQEI